MVSRTLMNISKNVSSFKEINPIYYYKRYGAFRAEKPKPLRITIKESRTVKILVVDDELYVCELLHDFLSSEGYEVKFTTSGEEAISEFVKDRPDIVLLDIRMPGINGIEVLRTMKGIDRHTGIIMLSAFGDLKTIEKALEMGAIHYIQKPFDLLRLHNVLAGWQSSNTEKSSHGVT